MSHGHPGHAVGTPDALPPPASLEVPPACYRLPVSMLFANFRFHPEAHFASCCFYGGCTLFFPLGHTPGGVHCVVHSAVISDEKECMWDMTRDIILPKWHCSHLKKKKKLSRISWFKFFFQKEFLYFSLN